MDASSTAQDSTAHDSTAHARSDPSYGFTELGLDQLRLLRRDAQEQEADLSYLRRLLHGRMDILRAELDRRRVRPAPATEPAAALPDRLGGLLDRLPAILADTPSPVRRPARHLTVGPPRGESYQREADALMGDVQLADLDAHRTAELLAAVERLAVHERGVSERRQRLQRTADDCSAEITRRYREGEARVDDLLAGG
ncbi:aerial mycelium formation protein [Kitasatospora kazusensis]|uniref:Aerial mycelium formation protein n=1 Tax=Kitasatospora kazusensis TaxID=407974 RepID=A0ABP5L667_9ACTN